MKVYKNGLAWGKIGKLEVKLVRLQFDRYDKNVESLVFLRMQLLELPSLMLQMVI